jgi:uncharacterized RDD family membrane protein YckC
MAQIMTDKNYQLASLWNRLVAFLVDMTIIFLLTIVGGELIMRLGVTNEALAVYPLLIVYFIVVAKKYPSQTVGKKLMGIATVDKATQQPPKLWQVVVRNFTRVFCIVDLLFMVSENRQRLGDMLAKTIVIKK